MSNIKVAVIEDIDDIRNAMKALIGGSHGFECTATFASASEAMHILPVLELDVVVMDINMPGISGIESVRLLKPQMPGVQFMMMTVLDNDDNIFNALKSGANGYLLKRTSPAQILEAITELHNGGSPMSAEIARKVVASLQLASPQKTAAESLTLREKEILELLSKGYLYKEISSQIAVSYETVKKHIQNIYAKLQVQNKVEALNKVFYT